METYHLEKDIHVYYITATSYPVGILQAHEQMHRYVVYDEKRNYFGISAPDKTGTIIYKSAAEELEKGEFSIHGLPQFVIKKGNYIFIDIKNFMNDIPAIGRAFDKLLLNPNIDPEGYCVEWYLTQNDVRCMVRLKDKKIR